MKTSTQLPIITCTECGGNAYAIEITFACEKCQTMVPINTDQVCEHIVFSKADNEHITKYIKAYFKRKAILEKKTIYDGYQIDNNDAEMYTHRFTGKGLSAIKLIKKKFKINTYNVVINTLVRNFLYLIKTLDSLGGDRVYLVDEHGNMTEDIKAELLKNIEKEYDTEKDKLLVDSFLEDISLRFNINNIKNKGK